MQTLVILLALTGCAFASGSYDGSYMLPKTSQNPYPYFNEYTGSWAHREAKIWGDAMTLVFEVYFWNTFRGIVTFWIFAIVWYVFYWVFQGLQLCAVSCCSSIRYGARAAAYIRVGFILFSTIYFLFAFIAAATVATWDPAFLIGVVPISSLVFMAGFSSTAYNLAGGMSILYAGLIEPGLVISFQSNSGMTIQGVVVSQGYQYCHVLTVVTVTGEDGEIIRHAAAPSGVATSPRTERGKRTEKFIKSTVTGASSRKLLEAYGGHFGIEDTDIEEGKCVVWIQAIPNSTFTNHVISMPHAAPGVAISHPVWSTRWSTVALDKDEVSCHHVNAFDKLADVPASNANGRAIIDAHMYGTPGKGAHAKIP